MPDGDRVFLTGASGFVGSHVLRELLDSGYGVRALVRSSSVQPPQPFDDRAERIEGDLRSTGGFARALAGCRYLVHCAALYSFAPGDREQIRAVNVDATASLLAAARLAGVERVVLTSSSATLGHAEGAYHRSKAEQELAAFAGRVPVVALLPTAPVGPGDWKPTPTGRLVLDFARGKVAARAPGEGGMNLVPVEDVARAHVTALRDGRAGERYVLGGENLTMDEIWQMLADVTGRPMPAWRAPYALAFAAGCVDEVRCRVQRGAVPAVPLEGVRLSRVRMFADSAPARAALAHAPGPLRDALARAVAWYRANGYVAAA